MDIKNILFDLIFNAGSDLENAAIETVEKDFVEELNILLSGQKRKISEVISGQNRIVVIGDIHCDFLSLAEIFRKLSLSDYNYFDNATFVFLGDFLDRGSMPIQTLKFLFGLKLLLKERCIFLRGNHDAIKFEESLNLFYSLVVPSETVNLLSGIFRQSTVQLFKEYFDSLPYFATLAREEKEYLFIHAGVPEEAVDTGINIRELSGEDIPESGSKAEKMLNSMLWGDPVDQKRDRHGNYSRFEYSRDEFESFMARSEFTHLIRGHEPVRFGFNTKFDSRLATIFSSGGNQNFSSYYQSVVPFPSFGIIRENGSLVAENIFTYHISGLKKPEEAAERKFIANDASLPYNFIYSEPKRMLKLRVINTGRIIQDLYFNSEFIINARELENIESAEKIRKSVAGYILNKINYMDG